MSDCYPKSYLVNKLRKMRAQEAARIWDFSGELGALFPCFPIQRGAQAEGKQRSSLSPSPRLPSLGRSIGSTGDFKKRLR